MIRLLLVEDDANLRYIIQGGLEDMIGGYEIKDAANGVEGLKIWQEWKPDVIVSDIEMPVMDGYTATKKIRSLERSDAKTIPIIAMTANAFAEDKKKTMEAGMNAHLSKPLNVPELMDTIRKFCDGKQMCQRPGKE